MTNAAVRYRATGSMFRLFARRFYLYDAAGALAYSVRMKAFRLREDVVVWGADGTRRLRIKARNVLDARGTYDVTDIPSGDRLGTARRNLLKSLLLDDWDLLDAGGTRIGKLQERASALAFLRRWFRWIPQTYDLVVGDDVVGHIHQRIHPCRLTYDVDLGTGIDERLGVAATVLILAIESKRD